DLERRLPDGVAGGVDGGELEAGVPQLTVVGGAEVLFGRFEVERTDGYVIVVAEEGGRQTHGENLATAFVELLDDAILIEQVGERAPDVDIREEVVRNAVAFELAAADVLVVGGVDVEVEEHRGDRRSRPVFFLVHRHAFGATQLNQCRVLVEGDAV